MKRQHAEAALVIPRWIHLVERGQDTVELGELLELVLEVAVLPVTLFECVQTQLLLVHL